MKIEDKTTFTCCDHCGKQEETRFFEVCGDNGGQIAVWFGLPSGWMNLIGDLFSNEGEIRTACSSTCAAELSKDLEQQMLTYWAKEKALDKA